MTTPRRPSWPRRLRSTIRRRVTGRGAAPRSAVPPRPAPGPRLRTVFVGGTGRSGTTIMGRLLGSHPAFRIIGVEVKFITAPGGLCDLVDGRTTYKSFRELMLTRWFDRTVANGSRRGVVRLMAREPLEQALDSLRDDLGLDPWRAGAVFVHRLLDPIAIADGKDGWVEMTPTNILSAERLLRMFPDAKLVHVVRDGRDVACSVVAQYWGPNDLDDALDWWARRYERSVAACERLPDDRVIAVHLESLVAGDREREYARLLAFLAVEDDPAMRAYFDTSVIPDRAHIGRWREQVPSERLAAFEAHHAALVDGLRARERFLAPPERMGAGAGRR